jgi:hypothetical protein
MFDFIRRFFEHNRHNVTTRRVRPDEPSYDANNLPPGCLPIESFYDLSRIPGTMLDVGTIAKLLQTSSNELVTLNQKIGVRAGCGHLIYAVDEVINQNSVRPVPDGTCTDCSFEAAELLNQNLISLPQAEQMSLYCSRCASHCDGCRRSNICVRHAQQFQSLNGTILLLCPSCLKKAEQDKFFEKTLALMLAPFVDYNRLPQPTQRRDPDGY